MLWEEAIDPPTLQLPHLRQCIRSKMGSTGSFAVRTKKSTEVSNKSRSSSEREEGGGRRDRGKEEQEASSNEE